MRFLIALLIASPALAQEFPLSVGDQRFDPAALEERLSGQTLTFYDNGKSRYYVDGRYSYTYFGDVRESAGGYWRVTDQGVVCVEFITGHARCDLLVQNGARLVLIDAKGDRYPVRSEE